MVNNETDTAAADSKPAEPVPTKVLTPAAQRALAEAAERRAAQEVREKELSSTRELDGRGGHDPVRYNDWEIKGLTADF
jgi:hypothetical protein